MAEFDAQPEQVQNFVGRDNEIKWLRQVNFRQDRWPPPIVVVHGPAGVGKTSLLRQFIATSRFPYPAVWFNCYSTTTPETKIHSFMKEMFPRGKSKNRELLVILDGTEVLNDQQFNAAVHSVINYKLVRGLFITSRREMRFEGSKSLELGPLDLESACSLLQAASKISLEHSDLTLLANTVNGYPLALQLIAELIRTKNPTEIGRVITGNFYDLSDFTTAPSSEILTVAKPIIISASQALVDSMQKRPEELHRLTPREFEKLLAELLTDMGWEVELTKATRDGGKDILAYMNTDLGRLLCLVEAKRYRSDRKIGVDLVRTLYGTLCDYKANSAMMVTTSSFSPDAHEFQQRHQYQLTLRDYADVVRWITKYKCK